MEASNDQNLLESIDEKNKYSEWQDSDEALLVIWYNNACCYYKMHEMAFDHYTLIHIALNIPIIVLSYISGVGNFAQSKISDEGNRDIASMIIGGINILAGLLATFYTFFDVGPNKENNKVQMLMYDKFRRNIQVEMSKQRKERMNKIDFMNLYKKEYDKLIESFTIIPKEIKERFLRETVFPENFNAVALNAFTQLTINNTEAPEPINIENDVDEYIEKFKNDFYLSHGRNPTKDELMNNIELKE